MTNFACYMLHKSVPVMLLVSVQSGYVGHLLIRQLKVEDVDILCNVGRITAAGDGYHPALIVPAQDDLH